MYYPYAEYNIIHAIKSNKKRVDKLLNLNGCLARRKQAKQYVIAECAKQKVKLPNDKIVFAACRILSDLKL